MQRDPGSSEVEVRRATADDAQAIGAVFDAAVRAGWTYLGELAQKPMFAPVKTFEWLMSPGTSVPARAVG